MMPMGVNFGSVFTARILRALLGARRNTQKCRETVRRRDRTCRRWNLFKIIDRLVGRNFLRSKGDMKVEVEVRACAGNPDDFDIIGALNLAGLQPQLNKTRPLGLKIADAKRHDGVTEIFRILEQLECGLVILVPFREALHRRSIGCAAEQIGEPGSTGLQLI